MGETSWKLHLQKEVSIKLLTKTTLQCGQMIYEQILNDAFEAVKTDSVLSRLGLTNNNMRLDTICGKLRYLSLGLWGFKAFQLYFHDSKLLFLLFKNWNEYKLVTAHD